MPLYSEKDVPVKEHLFSLFKKYNAKAMWRI
jgi:hypothetical protein